MQAPSSTRPKNRFMAGFQGACPCGSTIRTLDQPTYTRWVIRHMRH